MSGEPAPAVGVDPALFRHVLGHWATGVALVTAVVDGRPEGLVVNSLTSVSLAPPLVAFSASRTSLTWSRMRRAARLGVNVLPGDAEPFARRASAPGADRFDATAWRKTHGGVPALCGALAFLECVPEATHPAGDHWIVVARVEEARAGPAGGPLVFWRGGYRTIAH